MPTLTDLERRRKKRVKVQLPMRLNFSNAEGLASTKNISLLGACLNMNKEILPGTRVALSLDIPGCEVRAEGAIVRCDPEKVAEGKPGGYELGVFFSNFLPPGEEKLSDYLEYMAKEEEKQIRQWVEQYRAHIKQRKKEIARKRRLIENKRKARIAKRLKKELAKAAAKAAKKAKKQQRQQ